MGNNIKFDLEELKGVQPVLKVKGLTTKFTTEAGLFTAVDDISFNIFQGEV